MTLDLARWQFAIVTVFHFFFVPMTIGLGFMVAVMQTLGLVRKDETWDRLSRFFGRIFLISLAVGVVTGIVLEFQFGLNWSAYSVFVGNIFGAPLAIEGLLAFFLESTFIGLWMFGRERLSPRLHLATIWMVSVGTILSAFFILAANAWMQHPVGYKVEDGQAVLTDFWAVLGNSTLWASFVHTVVGGVRDRRGAGARDQHLASPPRRRATSSASAFRRATRFACAVVLVAVILVAVSGDLQARLMDVQQPMKMAAAEALYNTQNGASFSLLTIGNLSGQPIFQIRVPHLLSLIADLELERPGARDQPDAGHRGRPLRGGRLHPGPLAHLLVLPGHGGGRGPDDPAGGRGGSGWAGAGGCCRAGGSAGRRWPGSRCRSSPTPPAGSSPRPGASPGSCTA